MSKSSEFILLKNLPPVSAWGQTFSKFDVISDPKNRGRCLQYFTLVWDSNSYSRPPTLIFYKSEEERDTEFNMWKGDEVDHNLMTFQTRIPVKLEADKFY